MYRGILCAGLMVLLLVAVGCSRKAVPSVTTEVTDSIYVKEVPRYIPIEVPGDSVTITKWIECDSVTNKPKPFSAKKKSGRASSSVELKDSGKLIVDSKCDSLEKLIEVKDKEIYRLRNEKRTETVVVTEFKTRQIDIVCRWISGAVVLLLVGLAALKYLKTKLP